MCEILHVLFVIVTSLEPAGSTAIDAEGRLQSDCQRATKLTEVLDAERRACAELREDCQTLANKVIELKTALSQAERDLQSAL